MGWDQGEQGVRAREGMRQGRVRRGRRVRPNSGCTPAGAGVTVGGGRPGGARGGPEILGARRGRWRRRRGRGSEGGRENDRRAGPGRVEAGRGVGDGREATGHPEARSGLPWEEKKTPAENKRTDKERPLKTSKGYRQKPRVPLGGSRRTSGKKENSKCKKL